MYGVNEYNNPCTVMLTNDKNSRLCLINPQMKATNLVHIGSHLSYIKRLELTLSTLNTNDRVHMITTD